MFEMIDCDAMCARAIIPSKDVTSVDSGYQGLTEVTLINRLGQLCAASITDGLI